jgi:hypothetical protein
MSATMKLATEPYLPLACPMASAEMSVAVTE